MELRTDIDHARVGIAENVFKVSGEPVIVYNSFKVKSRTALRDHRTMRSELRH